MLKDQNSSLKSTRQKADCLDSKDSSIHGSDN